MGNNMLVDALAGRRLPTAVLDGTAGADHICTDSHVDQVQGRSLVGVDLVCQHTCPAKVAGAGPPPGRCAFSKRYQGLELMVTPIFFHRFGLASWAGTSTPEPF